MSMFNSTSKAKFVITLVLVFISLITVFLTRRTEKISKMSTNISSQSYETTLETINNYQQKYFEIIKRHNALLNLSGNSETMKDLKELKLLFQEVKSKTDKNNEYMMKYEEIKNKYNVNNGNTTLEINEFASKKYTAFNDLLNNLYEKLKNELPEKDFKQLEIAQKKWQKEVEDYDIVFKAQNFGSIGALVKFDYETNMCCFRSLLLMLYLKN